MADVGRFDPNADLLCRSTENDTSYPQIDHPSPSPTQTQPKNALGQLNLDPGGIALPVGLELTRQFAQCRSFGQLQTRKQGKTRGQRHTRQLSGLDK